MKLLLKNVHLVDPAASRNGEFDILIEGGRVAQIAYYGDESRIVVDIGSGRTVMATVANDDAAGRWRKAGDVAHATADGRLGRC